MDWMYKQSKPESEDYLLGKRVDKHIEEAVETVKDGMLIINLSFFSAIYTVICFFFPWDANSGFFQVPNMHVHMHMLYLIITRLKEILCLPKLIQP